MNKFHCQVEVTETYVVIVEAENQKEAEQILENMEYTQMLNTDSRLSFDVSLIEDTIKCTCAPDSLQSQMECSIHGVSAQLDRTQME